MADSSSAKPDMYQIDTSNVLFILSGAFVGLDAVIKRRVAKGVSQTLRRGHTNPDIFVAVHWVYCGTRL